MPCATSPHCFKGHYASHVSSVGKLDLIAFYVAHLTNLCKAVNQLYMFMDTPIISNANDNIQVEQQDFPLSHLSQDSDLPRI